MKYFTRLTEPTRRIAMNRKSVQITLSIAADHLQMQKIARLHTRSSDS